MNNKFENHDFRLLTIDEEKKLSNAELQKYYSQLREYYKTLPINKSSVCGRKLIHPIISKLMKLENNLFIEIENQELAFHEEPVIYVVNHSNRHDVPVAINALKEHFYLLAGNEVVGDFNGLMFYLNGAVFVDRKNKDSKLKSKDDLIKLVLNGKNILLFPESTWNLSANNIMLPMNWGVIEIAKKTGAPIVPVILEYRDNICHAQIGEKIRVSPQEDQKKAIDNLRDTMATMRWLFWEQYVVEKRNDISIEEISKYIAESLREYPKLDVEYENSTIYKEYPTYDEVFAHLDLLNVNSRNVFLLKKYF